MSAADELKKLEVACDGCGAVTTRPHDALVTVEDMRYQKLARLCRGRYSEPKAACLSKFIAGRKPTCVVCEKELYAHKANFRVRPVCKDCEIMIETARKAGEPKRWYALDTWATFGAPLPVNTHADYSELGDALLKALGSPRERVAGAEHLVVRKERAFDAHANGTVELTAEQAEGVRELAAAYAKVVDQVAKRQHAEGGNLLVKLARGEVSIDEFDRQVAAKGERE